MAVFSRKRHCRSGQMRLFRLTGLIGLVLLAISACNSQDTKILPLSIGVTHSPLSGLLYIAQDNQLFTKHGLEITLVKFADHDSPITQGLLYDQLDVVTSSAVAFMHQSQKTPDLRVFASIAKVDQHLLILGKRSHGIDSLDALSGKNIATSFDSPAHFVGQQTLDALSIEASLHDVGLDNFGQMTRALQDPQYDAYVMREPFTSLAVTQLGADAMVAPPPINYQQRHLLISRANTVVRHRVAVQRLLRALAEAEDLSHRNSTAVKQTIAKALGQPPQVLDNYWSYYEFGLSLEQALLPQFEQIARWYHKRALHPEPATAAGAPEPTPGDVEPLILSELLRQIRPAVVTLIK